MPAYRNSWIRFLEIVLLALSLPAVSTKAVAKGPIETIVLADQPNANERAKLSDLPPRTGNLERHGGQPSPEFYDPVEKQIEGWAVAVEPALLAQEHEEVAAKAFEALANHLQRIKYIFPADRLARMQTLRIWIELDNRKLSSMQYHPNRGWLVSHGHDPRLVKHVHIPRAKHLFARHMWAKHPYVVLHELAHAYHDQVLGFDHPDVLTAFKDIKNKGIYEEVLLFTGAKVRHYGLSNHKEYFAESTESYFGVNDFYPFVRAELNEHDPGMFSLMEEIWGPVE